MVLELRPVGGEGAVHSTEPVALIISTHTLFFWIAAICSNITPLMSLGDHYLLDKPVSRIERCPCGSAAVAGLNNKTKHHIRLLLSRWHSVVGLYDPVPGFQPTC